MDASTGWDGIPVKQVVAIEAILENSRVQIGSGYLVDQQLVLTAEHCIRDKTRRGSPVTELSVIADGAKATVSKIVSCRELDLAVLMLRAVPDRWPTGLRWPAFARVDREHSGELRNCEAIGFPLWQYEPTTNARHSGTLRGTINQTDERETRRLLLRHPEYDIRGQGHEAADEDFPWGGLSGALVFHAGLALGVVIEHHPRQGAATVQLSAFDKLALYAAADPASASEAGAQQLAGAKAVADALKLPVLDDIPVIGSPAACRLGRGNSWLFRPAQARSHFERRARGQRSGAGQVDMFRGRDAALRRIRSWLCEPEERRLPLVVTGQPGAGKSAVLARVAMQLSLDPGRPGLAFHAAHATVAAFREALADLAGLTGDAEEITIVDEIRAMGAHGVVPVLVDALDEAETSYERSQIAGLIKELADLPGLRLVVATRPQTTGDRLAPPSLLRSLGVTSADSDILVDLDIDCYFRPAELAEFADVLLARNSGSPGTGKAGTEYGKDKALRSRVAAAIADRAGRNYLVADLAASALSADDSVVDPASAGYDPVQIPGAIGEALDKYLRRMPADSESRIRGLLTALAYARGEGLDDDLWLRFTKELSHSAAPADLETLRHTSVADFLSQSRSGAAPVTTLFHQALREELLRARPDRASDEQKITKLLLGGMPAMPGGAANWSNAHPYTLRHLSSHARAAGDGGFLLDRLLRDAGYLCAAEPGPLLEALADYAGPLARHVQAYERFSEHRLASGREEWPAYLGLAAAQTGAAELAAAAAALPAEAAWRPRWAAWSPISRHRVLDRRPGAADVRTIRPLRFGGRAALCVGSGGFLRVLDVEDGRCLAQTRFNAEDLAVSNVTSGPVVFASAYGGNLLLWEPEDEGRDPVVIEGPTGPARCQVAIGQASGSAVAVAVAEDGDESITVAGCYLNGVRRWARQLDGGKPKIAVSRLGSAGVAFVSSRHRGEELLFAVRLTDGEVIGKWDLDTSFVDNLTSLPGGSTARLAYGGTSELVIVEIAPQKVPASWRVPAQSIYAPVVTETRDTPLLACPDGNGIRFRSLADGRDAGFSWLGRQISCMAAISSRDHSYIVTGHRDGSVRRWSLDALFSYTLEGPPAETQASDSVAVTAAGDSVLVGAGNRIQRRDLANGRLLAETSEEFAGRGLRLLSSGKQNERLANYGAGGLVTISPGSLEILHQYRADELDWIEDMDTMEVAGQTLLATVARSGCGLDKYAVNVWSASTMEHMIRLRQEEYEDKPLLAVRFAMERGNPVILAGGGGRVVRLWRLGDSLATPPGLVDGELITDSWEVAQHDDYVQAIAVDARRANRFASVGDDGKVRITDLNTNQTVIISPLHPSPLKACCLIGDIAIAGGDAGILTAWRLDSCEQREVEFVSRPQIESESAGQPLFEIRLDAVIRDIAIRPGEIIIATDEGTITLDADLDALGG